MSFRPGPPMRSGLQHSGPWPLPALPPGDKFGVRAERQWLHIMREHTQHTHTHNIRGCVVYVYDPICENIMTSSVSAPWPRLPSWRRRRRRNVVRKFLEALQSMSEARTTRDHRTNCICLGTLQICTAYNFESRPENWAKVFWPIATTFTYIFTMVSHSQRQNAWIFRVQELLRLICKWCYNDYYANVAVRCTSALHCETYPASVTCSIALRLYLYFNVALQFILLNL